MAFDPFRGYVADLENPSIYDVQRRQKLADLLASNRVDNAGPLGALATALAGTASGYENTQAAQEAQAGYDQSQKALAQALSGGVDDPATLVQAAGNPFMPQSQTSLMDDLIKRKMGIGETFFGTPQVSFDDQGNPHYSIIGSLGSVKEIKPPEGAGGSFSIKNQLVDTPTAAGVAVNPFSGAQVTSGVAKDNATAAFDSEWGKVWGGNFANAPEVLQKEGNLVKTQAAQHQLVSNKIDTALSQIQANPGLMTGTVGAIINAAPGTPQYDLAQTLQTIKANIGFDTLQNIRDNSQTGGALGQISNMEEQLLQAVNGSLEQGQSAAQLAANLKDIQKRINDITIAKQQAVAQDIARYKAGPQKAPSLGGGAAPDLNLGAVADPLGIR